MSASAQDLTKAQRRIIADVQKATDMIDKHASSDNPSVSCWAGYWRRVRAQLIAAFATATAIVLSVVDWGSE